MEGVKKKGSEMIEVGTNGIEASGLKQNKLKRIIYMEKVWGKT